MLKMFIFLLKYFFLSKLNQLNVYFKLQSEIQKTEDKSTNRNCYKTEILFPLYFIFNQNIM